jgi:hypothetical protein
LSRTRTALATTQPTTAAMVLAGASKSTGRNLIVCVRSVGRRRSRDGDADQVSATEDQRTDTVRQRPKCVD